MSVLARPDSIGGTDFKHVGLAVRVHLAATYAAFSGWRLRDPGRLTSRQRHAAREFIKDSLSADILLADIAKASAVSIGSLSRSLKLELGTSPHQWMVKRRIVSGRRLMHHSKLGVSDTSVICGFFVGNAEYHQALGGVASV